MDWLKNLVDGGLKLLQGDIKNPDKLEPAMVEAIGTYFGCVCDTDPLLAADLVRYVVDGGDEGVLSRLLSNNSACINLGYGRAYNYNQEVLRKRFVMLSGERKASPGIWIRIGKVFEVGWKSLGMHQGAVQPGWLRALLGEMSYVKSLGRSVVSDTAPREIADIEAVLAAEELAPDLLVRVFLDSESSSNLSHTQTYTYSRPAEAFTGLNTYFSKHQKLVRSLLMESNAEQKVFALSVLTLAKFEFDEMLDVLIQMAVGTSKTVRDATYPIVNELKHKVRPVLESVLKEGGSSERNEAVNLLYRLFGNDCAELLNKHSESEKSEKVRQTIASVSASNSAENVDLRTNVQLPPVEVEIDNVPLSERVKEGLKEYLNKGLSDTIRAYEQQVKMYESPNRPKWMRKPEKPDVDIHKLCKTLIAFLEGDSSQRHIMEPLLPVVVQHAGTKFGEWFAPPDVKLIHVVRFCYALRLLNVQTGYDLIWITDRGIIAAYLNRCGKPFGLREFDRCVATLPNCSPGVVGRSYLQNNSKWSTFATWCKPEGVWPLFIEYPDLLIQALNPTYSSGNVYNDYQLMVRKQSAFDVLAMLPEVPEGFIPLLWELALGEAKAFRGAAQQALARVPGKTERIVVSLADGKQTIRATAAEWLGRLGDKNAIEPLKKAFIKEKQEVVRGALLHALDLLGADVNAFLNRDNLLKEALAGLAKKQPKGFEWFPLTSVPELHWADSGKRVEPAIVQWWIVQSVQQKSPAPGPLIKRYLSMCKTAETARFANFVLSSWIAQDTRHIGHEEAAERAQAEADKYWPNIQNYKEIVARYRNDKNNFYKELYQRYSTECLGSAIEFKGLLAITAAAGDADSVKMSQKYIKNWYGQRVAQCKSLVEVLAWLDHPLALQALLALANRFRTKSIKQLAEDFVKETAERRGWTIDELADRTIPDGGFARLVDEEGNPIGDVATLTLDFGNRQFEARLNDELEVTIYSKEDGKQLKSLPEPGKSDDEEKGKDAKKLLSDARKAVKEVVKRQTERLYESLCTQRSWIFADWQRYLAQHPIVGRLCTRVVWAAFNQPSNNESHGEFISCFRLLEDGSLTNEEDEKVEIPDNAIVLIAHTFSVSPEQEKAWIKHLEDYDVTPIFKQFGRATFRPSQDILKATEISEFEGHSMTSFKLRGKANKLGYQRGAAEDGGAFYQYKKPFSSLGIQSIIEFSGSYLPEEDIPVSLTNLYFTQITDGSNDYWEPEKMPLERVPSVLLSECYNDVRQIAAEGTGYDPKWKEKSLFH